MVGEKKKAFLFEKMKCSKWKGEKGKKNWRETTQKATESQGRGKGKTRGKRKRWEKEK